jgi:hypothetical protein
MTVYVDNLRVPKRIGCVSGRWSHLSADTPGELHAFAARLDLRRSWFQDNGDGRWHYDLVDTKRRRAIELGAVPVDIRDFGAFIHARRTGRPWNGPKAATR